MAKLRTLLTQPKMDISSIEIIGHTDEQAFSGQCNLDVMVKPYLNQNKNVTLTAADNAGLGLARAEAFIRRLRQVMPETRRYQIIPMPAAQLQTGQGTLAPGGHTNKDEEKRRRSAANPSRYS